jgi:hypothetical protein
VKRRRRRSPDELARIRCMQRELAAALNALDDAKHAEAIDHDEQLELDRAKRKRRNERRGVLPIEILKEGHRLFRIATKGKKMTTVGEEIGCKRAMASMIRAGRRVPGYELRVRIEERLNVPRASWGRRAELVDEFARVTRGGPILEPAA